MHHRVRHASINKSAKLFSKKKIRGGECKGGIYRLLWGVSPDRPRGYEDTSWTKALEAWQTTVRGWTWPQPTSCIDAKILPRPSLMVRQTRQEEHPYLFMKEGQEHSRTASLHELYLASVCDFTKHWAAYSHTGRTQFLKTKIIHIHITKAQSLATDTREDVLYQEEMATIHSSERQVRRAARLITRMLDSSSALPTSNRDNLRVMTVFEPVSKSHNIELRISLTNGARSVQGSAHESEGGLGGENHGHGMQFGGASWGSE